MSPLTGDKLNHLTEEELIAHAYAEEDSHAAEAHLAQCPECSRNYASLRSDLAEIKLADPPLKDAAYGSRVWASLSGQLPAYEANGHSSARGPWFRQLRQFRQLRPFHWSRGIGYAAACAGLAVCAFLGGRLWEHQHAAAVATALMQQTTPVPAQFPAQPSQKIVVVILSDHLERSEQLLVQLKHADAESPSTISPLRDEAQSLLKANGVCRERARRNEDPALSAALDRLDHLLTELASQPDDGHSAEIVKLQNELEADGLLFEVRVLRSRQEPSGEPGKGGTI